MIMKYTIILFCILLYMKLFSANTLENAVNVTYKASHNEISPGDTLLIEFSFNLKKDWHIYWINPGDAGLPTKIEPKENPVGNQVEVLMEIPKILKEEDLVFYCYENKTTMISKYVIDKNANLGTTSLEYDISWLMCKNECYPGKISFNIPIKVSNKSKVINKIDITKYPKNSKKEQITASIMNNSIFFTISGIPQSTIDFYPLTSGYIVYDKIEIKNMKNNHQIFLPLDKFRENDPEIIEGLIFYKNKKSNQIIKSRYSNIIINN